MKSWPDRLRELTVEQLEEKARRQRAQIEIAKRDLKFIENALAEKRGG